MNQSVKQKAAVLLLLAALAGLLFGCGAGEEESPTQPDGEQAQETASGAFGADVVWHFYEDGTLTVEGTGDIPDYPYGEPSPLEPYTKQIVRIKIRAGVAAVGSYVFAGCGALEEIALPDTVTALGAGALKDCASLKSAVLPDSVTSVGDGLFLMCERLETVRLPAAVTHFGRGVFFGCSALRQITVPEGVVTLESGSFETCTSLQTLYLPKSVTAIEAGALPSVEQAVSVCYAGSAEDWENIETPYTVTEADGKRLLDDGDPMRTEPLAATLTFSAAPPEE